jgi:hypothetical protein
MHQQLAGSLPSAPAEHRTKHHVGFSSRQPHHCFQSQQIQRV